MKNSFFEITLMVGMFMLVSGWCLAETHMVTKDSEFVSAVETCSEGDTILMAPGEYWAEVTITTSITLRGETGYPEDVKIMRWETFNEFIDISGGGAVKLEDCQAKINECEFKGGRAFGSGGGVSMEGGTLDMNYCIFRENIAQENGGGLELKTVEAVIVGCSFEENGGYNTAGAMHVWAGSMLEMSDTEITGNFTHLKIGGMVVQGGTTAVLSDCHFADNEGPLSDDGSIGTYCSALFRCCYLELDHWYISGTVEFDDSGCQVATQQLTLGDLKAMYR